MVVHQLKLNTAPQQTESKWTDRPAPYLPGLYSLQAVSNDENEPDLTVFREDPDSALLWKDELVRRGGFCGFLLRHGQDAWDVFDELGIFVGQSKDVVSHPIREVTDAVLVDRSNLEEEGRTALFDEGISLICTAESHAGASAADHSNFVVLCRRLLVDADPSDMQHVYLVESRRWPCRVVGIFADVSKLSPGMQDVFLDRVKWLYKGWPLITRNHLDMLADRLSKARTSFVTHLLADCGRSAGMSQEEILSLQSDWMLASPGAKYRFSQHIVHALKKGILFAPATAEEFDPDVVECFAHSVVDGYRKILR